MGRYNNIDGIIVFNFIFVEKIMKFGNINKDVDKYLLV
jgi:hypothetical protein